MLDRWGRPVTRERGLPYRELRLSPFDVGRRGMMAAFERGVVRRGIAVVGHRVDIDTCEDVFLVALRSGECGRGGMS
jgi:hypothetical protein